MNTSAGLEGGEWQKILYIRQDYPDNYVDRKLFLAELKKNVTCQLYTYSQLVGLTMMVTQQLASVLIYVAFFYYLYVKWLSVQQLLYLANTVSIIFYFTWLWYVRRQRNVTRRMEGRQPGKSGVLLIMTLLGLTPILQTLTQDVSSDSIWSLTTGCFLVNLCFFDYGRPARMTNVEDSLSLNAAVLGGVMLASRLPSKPHVFGLMCLSVDWFGFFPMFRRMIATRYPQWMAPLTILLVVVTVSMLASIKWWLASTFIMMVLMVSFLLPAIFVHLQKYKNEIHGPWDEAPVRLNKK